MSPLSRQNPSLFSSPLLCHLARCVEGPKSGDSVESLLVPVLKGFLALDFLLNRRDSWGDWSRDRLLAVLRWAMAARPIARASGLYLASVNFLAATSSSLGGIGGP